MQNVACATITVKYPNGTPPALKAELSAMPVTMPGSAIGSTTSRLITSRPKNRYRWTAKARQVPSTRASAVAPRPTLTLVQSADRAPALSSVRRHHSSVSPLGGKPNVRDELNELTSTSSSGT